MRRTILIWWVSLFCPLAAPAVAPDAPRPLPEAAAEVSRAPLADRDGDRISDGLQAALAAAGPADRFRVVVSFSGPGDAASAGRAVGGPTLDGRTSDVCGPGHSITAASTTTHTEMVTPSGGFTGDVSLAVSSKLPNGVTATFSPNPVAVPGSVPVTSALTVTTRAKSRRGTYTLTITGTSGSLSHTNTVQLIIQ